jgi:hypothetical protein
MSKWKLVLPAALAVVLFLAPSAQAGPNQSGSPERVIQFRSAEAEDLAPDPLVCADAPFPVNLATAAALFVPQVRGTDGQVVNLGGEERGTGTACFGIPVDVILGGFPAWSQVELYAEIAIGDVVVRADGVCTVSSNDIPTAGLVLAGCGLDVVEAPRGFLGGNLASNSLFNPFQVPGFFTGSFWTLRLFEE